MPLQPGCLPVSSALDQGQLLTSACQFFKAGLASNTRTTYTAGIRRYTNICKATKLRILPASDPTLTLIVTHHQLTPRLQIILKGIKKHQAVSHPPRVHLPITIHILKQIRGILSHKKSSYSEVMLWATCCLAFFGFLCISDFTILSVTSYDPKCHLSMKDVAVDNRDNPRLLQVAIKQSKTDPFRRGVNIYLGAIDSTICPIKAVLAY